METQTNLNQKVIYDPNSGRNVFEMKPTRSFYLMTASTLTTSANQAIASTVVGTNQNIMITGMSAGLIDSTGASSQVTVTLQEGSSSVTCIALQAGSLLAGRAWNNITATSDAPILYSIGSGATSGTRTIQLTASSIGTYNGAVWGAIYPVITKVMP
jgi:hypothetical protein